MHEIKKRKGKKITKEQPKKTQKKQTFDNRAGLVGAGKEFGGWRRKT